MNHDLNNIEKREYIPEKFWEERAKDLGELGDGYTNRVFQDYEHRIKMKKAILLLKKIEGVKVLDVGCGTGRWSVQFAKMGALVTGIDISPEMLRIAKERADKEKLDIKFIHKRLDDPHFLEEMGKLDKFDIILSVTVLQHIMSQEALELAAKNIVGCLAQKSRLLIIESAPTHETSYDVTDRGVKHMRLRTKQDWTHLFEGKGLKLEKMKEGCSVGRSIVSLASKTNNRSIIQGSQKIAEILDMNISDWPIFKRYSMPTLFLFSRDTNNRHI